MSAHLRVVATPDVRDQLIAQARMLTRIHTEAQRRLDIIGTDRRRILRALHDDGMGPSDIARATGTPRRQVIRILGVIRYDR